MAKLLFKYGAMGCGKSLELLRVAYNYLERDQNILLFTSAVDDRGGIKNKIKSRVGLEMDAIPIAEHTSILSEFITKHKNKKIDCVLVDESQFLKKHHIEQLSDIVDNFNVPVICYGLKSDYKNEPFEGSTYLLSMSDNLEEIKSICWCGKKSTVNARIVDGKIVKNGEQIQVGGNESYVSLCRKHYKDNKISK